MSNATSIAAVTAVLRHLLESAISAAAKVQDTGLAGATVTSARPGSEKVTDRGINVYLYGITPNAALRNADLPTRTADGTTRLRPQIALTLHYLLSCHGDEDELEPQRLLGVAVQVLHAQPTLSPDLITKSIQALNDNQGPKLPFLLKVDLAGAIERVRFVPETLDIEQLSKLWTIFSPPTHALSVGYQASVVLVEAPVSTAQPLPVRVRTVLAGVMSQPSLDRVERVQQAGQEPRPIGPGDRVALVGHDLVGPSPVLLVDGRPGGEISLATDERVEALLEPELPAGVHAAQVGYRQPIGDPPSLRMAAATNAAPFLLHPSVTGIVVKNKTVQNGLVKATLEIALTPKVRAGQRAVVLLSELQPPGATAAARAYSATAAAVSADAGTIDFPVEGVAQGTYLVRVQIDGANSPLTVQNGRYSGPQAVLS
jgi:hypothetical protein